MKLALIMATLIIAPLWVMFFHFQQLPVKRVIIDHSTLYCSVTQAIYNATAMCNF